MVPTLEVLRRIPLFVDLSDDVLACIVDVARAHTYEPGETIIFEGDPCRAAYFIAEGHVRVYRL